MKILLTTLNSKYTHTSLALRLISNWLNEHQHQASWAEYTINTPLYQILGDLYRQQPDVLIFSVYIWNGTETRILAAELKKLMPKLIIVFGGPEVSFDSNVELKESPFIDFIVRGEGEQATEELITALNAEKTEEALKNVKGLTWRRQNEILVNPDQDNLNMDLLAFPYPDLDKLSHRILYYESSRGCPYNCSYCLSSATKGVRFRNTELVEADLKRFLTAEVTQVKFIDRTFNANPDRALKLWKYLAQADKGVTNFHFEITAELLRPEDIAFLETVRPGLFQFEIGIQTTMKEAREAVNRRLAFDQIKKPVQAVLNAKNLHVHLDLIAGLPFESYERFMQSFDDVYALNPQVLQLGFLKLIKGSGIRSQELMHGYIYEAQQPYEVLENRYISFGEMLKLKDFENCLDHLHNSKRFVNSLELVMANENKPSLFYEKFSQWLREQGCFEEAIKTERWYSLLLDYAKANDYTEAFLDCLKACLLTDYMAALGKQPPEWLWEGLTVDAKTDAFELVKLQQFESLFPNLVSMPPKERIKRIRFLGVSRDFVEQFNKISELQIIKLQTNTSQNALLIVELSEKHLVSERYSTYLFV